MPNASCTNLESLALYLCRFLFIYCLHRTINLHVMVSFHIYTPSRNWSRKIFRFIEQHEHYSFSCSISKYPHGTHTHTHMHLHTKTSDGNFPFVTLILTIKKQFSYFPIFSRSHSTVHLFNSVAVHL